MTGPSKPLLNDGWKATLMPETPDFEKIARECFGEDPITIPANTLKVGETVRLTGTPAADAHAKTLTFSVGGTVVATYTLDDQSPIVARVAEALRLIWNARGTADLVKLEADLSGLMGVTAAGPYVKNLDRALRRLDR